MGNTPGLDLAFEELSQPLCRQIKVRYSSHLLNGNLIHLLDKLQVTLEKSLEAFGNKLQMQHDPILQQEGTSD